MSDVRVDRREDVGIVTLDRPEKRNALSPAVMEELAAAIDGFDTDSEVHCIVVSGSDEVFAAGASSSKIFSRCHLSWMHLSISR